MSLEGKTVVVTGAAGGLGRAMVDGFRARGARVIGVGRPGERLDALAGERPDVEVVAADLATGEGAEAALAAAGPELDVLCNNAGVMDGFHLLDEVSDELWDRNLAVNLTAPFLLSRGAVRAMLPRGGGAIVNTISVAGLRGGRAGPAYTAARWGLVGLTANVAATFGARGIRCNAICPGGMDTGILGRVQVSERGAPIATRDRDKPAPAPPEQVAAVAVWLASPESGRINGAAIPVDAGWIAY